MFWWDFLVGDTPEITVAVIVILGLVAVISKVWHANTLAYVSLPVLLILALILSLSRARRGVKSE
jgi:uncharacterized protein (DUF983 family)